MNDIGWELLYGIGRFFAHPLTYLIPIVMFVLGWRRVVKERRDFHTRVFRAVFDVTAPLLPGLAAGLAGSAAALLLGVTVPFSFLVLLSLFTGLILLSGRVKWLSPAFTVSAAVLLALILPLWDTGSPRVDAWLQELGASDYQAVLFWLAVLIILESVLVFRSARFFTSPLTVKSSRGKWLGAHRMRRIWLLPSVFFIPGGMLDAVSWWPLLPVGEGGLALFFFPLAVGTDYTIYHTLPRPALQQMGRRLCLLGLAAGAGAGLSFYYPQAVLYTAAAVFVLRTALQVWQRMEDHGRQPFFQPGSRGVKILAVLPESPAAKMGMTAGEIIWKVNNIPVHSKKELYYALQKNSAHCRLEVMDTNGERRHVQSALYDNEHHEIGVLTVKENDDLPASGIQG
ncbi:PDZ domain-containing protein [Salibacterium lacus]|uniref:PDZ domain-containing protein n=1 Tax=Salibacterium lacus TaxID=1898109 RepID=A0ABW5T0S9_9BACI